jgi:predicted PurR-regulated permease PerM
MTESDGLVPVEPAPGQVPDWLSDVAAFGWRILAVAGLGVVLVWLAVVLLSVTASLVLSAVIAVAAAPVVLSLRGRGWSRVRAALAAWALAALIIVGALVLIVIAFVPVIADLLHALQRGLDALRSGSVGSSLPPELESALERVVTVIAAFVEEQVGQLVARASTAATIGILTTFLTFFFLLDADHGVAWVLQALPEGDRGALQARGRDAALRVGGLLQDERVVNLHDRSGDENPRSG